MRNIILFCSITFILFSKGINAQCYKKISVNQWVTLAIQVDGTLRSWGVNSNGQLGDGTTTSRNIPTQIGTSNLWQEISVNYSHSIGINNGRLFTWGNNADGQLGDGTFTNRLVPTQIGTTSNWAKISAGDNHCGAIKQDGTLWAWGSNNSGQLGTGNFTASNVPLQIGNDNNWAKVVTGLRRSIALKTDGTLWGWGQSTPTGPTSSTNANIPLQIGTSNQWRDISLSYEHILLLKNNNTLWGWGQNNYGALGNGTTINFFTSPEQIGTDTNWKTVTAGRDFSTATKQNGTLWAWGLNVDSQFGNNSTNNSTIPVQIGTQTNWRDTYSSYNHTIAQKTINDQIWVWGLNVFGQLGNGNTNTVSVPLGLGSCNTLSNTNQNYIMNSFSIYPNPTNSKLSIISSIDLKIESIQIIDSNGKGIKIESENTQNISVEDLSIGIYFIKIQTNDSIHIQKFIKI